MRENSLHKCEHHACMRTHSHIPGIVLCPEFDSNFLKSCCGLEAPTECRCLIHSKTPESLKARCIKHTDTHRLLQRLLLCTMLIQDERMEKGSYNGRQCVEVLHFASHTSLRPQLEATKLNICQPGKRKDCW